MENLSSEPIETRVALAWILVSACTVLGFGQTTSSGKQDAEQASQHHQVQMSEELHIGDSVNARLTPGQKKAVTDAKSLGPDNAAVFKPDGTLVKIRSVERFGQGF